MLPPVEYWTTDIGFQVQHSPFYTNLGFACKANTLWSLYSHALLVLTKLKWCIIAILVHFERTLINLGWLGACLLTVYGAIISSIQKHTPIHTRENYCLIISITSAIALSPGARALQANSSCFKKARQFILLKLLSKYKIVH